jgi:Transmembrane protein 43
MAKRRKFTKRSTSGVRALLIVVLIGAIAAAVWYARHRTTSNEPAINHHADVSEIASSETKPAQEPRKVRLNGKLEITKPPHDSQLGVAAPSAVLLRHVEMFQWQESCDTKGCRYEKGWSGAIVDSQKFRVPTGHENPQPPFSDAKFSAGGVKLGGLDVDAETLAQLAPADFPVHAADLPPNLAASFRVQDGVLYAGGDPAHPSVGALRVSYRAVGVGDVELTGWQRGTKLAAH